MKKKMAIAACIFLICALMVKSIEIYSRFDMGIWDYIQCSMPLTQEEREYLGAREIKYGIDIDNMPYAFISADSGESSGMLKDYFNQLSIILETEFYPVSYDDYHLALKLKSGELNAAAINKSDTYEDVFMFTQPLYVERSKILVREDSEFENINDVRDVSIAVIAGSAAHHAANEYFTESKNVNLILTSDLDESLYLFGMREVEGIIGDESQLSYYLNRNIKDKWFRFLEGSVSEEEIGVAVNKDQQILLSILNKGILEVKKDGQYNHIHSKWFGSLMPEIDDFIVSSSTANLLIILMGISFVFILWNITVARRVDVKTSELNESREVLRTIMDSLYDGIIVTDKEGEIQVCNGTALKLLHADNENVQGRNIYKEKAMEPFLSHVNMEEAFKLEDKYFLVSLRKLRGASEKQLWVIRDYTSRYRYESLIRQEAKMIAVGELSAGLAHEIRNPLGIIKNYIYIIRDKMTGSIEKHAVGVIDNSVDRINGLIDNLLHFSRFSVDRPVMVNIRELILQIVSLERKNLEKNNIEISVVFCSDEYETLLINEDIIRLIIVNLINNSIDALRDIQKSKNSIKIMVECGNGLHIDFEDNGKGIPKEQIEEIFNPFFTTKDNGTGLGLYIIGSEIREAGGSITVESEVGRGTCFHIILPADKEKNNEQ